MSAKNVYLIRHAESLHNEAMNGIPEEEQKDPLFWDADLSARGHEQVIELKTKAESINPQVIISSPLTRALKTTLGAFGHRNIPIVVDPMGRERIDNACDIGTPKTPLSSGWETHVSFSFDNVEKEIWWYSPFEDPSDDTININPQNYKKLFVDQRWSESFDLVRERISKLEDYIRGREESEIAVVGHSSFFKEWLKADSKMSNCHIHHMVLK